MTNDLRFKPRDKADYEAWEKERAAAKQALYRGELELREARPRECNTP